jgi:hypothetical protein
VTTANLLLFILRVLLSVAAVAQSASVCVLCWHASLYLSLDVILVDSNGKAVARLVTDKESCTHDEQACEKNVQARTQKKANKKQQKTENTKKKEKKKKRSKVMMSDNDEQNVF